MSDDRLKSKALPASAMYNGVLPGSGIFWIGKPFEINRALRAGYASFEKRDFTTLLSLDNVYESITGASPTSTLDGSKVKHVPLPATYQYHLSSEAIEDLRAIWDEANERDTPKKAELQLRELVLEIGRLALSPGFGAVRRELLGTPHCFPNRYALYFHPTLAPVGIAVVRVLDGRGIHDEGAKPGEPMFSTDGIFTMRDRRDAPPIPAPNKTKQRIIASHLIMDNTAVWPQGAF